jgi:putative membrane protein
VTPPSDNERGDPRIYMAAERTFLAWIRTAIALMAFGFVISRFGLFLRMLAASTVAPQEGSGASVIVGMSLIAVGVVVTIVAAIRHHRYVRAIDTGRFRSVFGSTFAFAIAGLLAVVGFGMALLLARLQL